MQVQVPANVSIPVDCGSAGSTVANIGGSTVYYRDEFPASASTSDGSIAAGTSATLTGTQFVFAASSTVLQISTASQSVTDTVTRTVPAGPTDLIATALSGGGTLSAAPYYYQVTAVDGTGLESAAHVGAAATASANGRISLTWTAKPGAVGYRVYRSIINFGNLAALNMLRVASLGAVTTWTDTGVASGTQALPTLSTATWTATASAPAAPVSVPGVNVFSTACPNGVTTPVVVVPCPPLVRAITKMVLSTSIYLTAGSGVTSYTVSINRCDVSGNVLGNVAFWTFGSPFQSLVSPSWTYDPRDGDPNLEDGSGRYLGLHVTSSGGTTTADDSFLHVLAAPATALYWPHP